MSSVTQNIRSVSEPDEINIGRLIGEMIDHRKLIIGITSLFTVIAVLFALFSTPIYQADALVQVEPRQANELLDSLSKMLPQAPETSSAPEIALLKSRMILGKTVNDFNLEASVRQKYFPVIGRGFSALMGEEPGHLEVTRLYLPEAGGNDSAITVTVKDATHYQVNGDGFTAQGEVGVLLEDKGISLMVKSIDAKPDTKFTVTQLTQLDAINNLLASFTVLDKGNDTGILNLTLTNTDPALAAQLLDNISQNYLAQNIARQAAHDEKSLDFLNVQLPKVRSDLDASEDKLNDYRKKINSVDLTLEAKSILEQIVNVENQLNELTFREAEISQLYTKDHPTYKALLEKRQTLEDERAQLNKKVSTMPTDQQEVLRLSRNVESSQAVYMQLLNRQQELSIAKSSAIGNVRIIDSAVTSPGPIKPKRALIVVIGLILGLFLSMGLVLVRVFLRRGIDSPEQLEELGINVYANIPESEWLNKRTNWNDSKKLKNKTKKEAAKFLALENPTDLSIEAIRGLRTSLHFAMMEARNNILMISGASPNAGKTFISSNLAATLAVTGRKVLFIDADIRRGYAHTIFGQKPGKGLSDHLSGRASIDEIIHPVANAGFDFISRGHIAPNPAELLMHPRLEQLLEWAKEHYDLVIIDTSPILAVTDAAIVGRYAGTTLLVARFEANSTKEIEVSIKRFEQSGVEIKGCILNGVVRKASSYYSNGYSNYGYSYSDGKNK
ncbi:polysaccharide biosynthesis tyrosine autokinase [Serratia sp. M24T3]|uniref:polysaccharide biosynthesis tyrosine autokinase n=1 Tax=Serratia sp. M24T3 TaxID=932213 RepID=UPI00025B955C|nr:polysaccharide biosynthesis tyrosine autokinase [Serratia sp. M24T3]EIC86650.1 tyrosine autokinase [Serratia sp. M24T3]